MNGYREFWNRLIYFNEGMGPQSLERYWTTLAVFVVICLAIGLISTGRLRFVAPAATVITAAAYIISLVPFMVWTASCSRCQASLGYDTTTRSIELAYIHLYWSGVYTMGVAALWIGVLLNRGAAQLTDWRQRAPGAEQT